jgi:hypothetical protein
LPSRGEEFKEFKEYEEYEELAWCVRLNFK